METVAPVALLVIPIGTFLAVSDRINSAEFPMRYTTNPLLFQLLVAEEILQVAAKGVVPMFLEINRGSIPSSEDVKGPLTPQAMLFAVMLFVEAADG